jgi:hypothetical protein
VCVGEQALLVPSREQVMQFHVAQQLAVWPMFPADPISGIGSFVLKGPSETHVAPSGTRLTACEALSASFPATCLPRNGIWHTVTAQ